MQEQLVPLYRGNLPQMAGGVFLTDAGIETYLIFHRGVDLPLFATFTLHRSQSGRRELKEYFHNYTAIAREHGAGLVLETATWRANPDWGAQAGYSRDQLAEVNLEAVALLEEVRQECPADQPPVVISGNIGPRGDGYSPASMMSAEEARDYHTAQVATFAGSNADLVTALTMTHVGEAAGIALAARSHDIPVVISFTVETDGRLPSGDTLEEAIMAVDLASEDYPAYYMVNCAHPSHFAGQLPEDHAIAARIGGIRANASKMSHAELDEAEQLDEGDAQELGSDYQRLLARLPAVRVIGGCCGTDHRHVAAMAQACLLEHS